MTKKTLYLYHIENLHKFYANAYESSKSLCRASAGPMLSTRLSTGLVDIFGRKQKLVYLTCFAQDDEFLTEYVTTF
jgi:hypothetical protein